MDNVTFTPPAITDLKDMLQKTVEKYGGKTAYQIKDENGNLISYTYNMVYSLVNGLGTSLLNMGLRGKKIAIIGLGGVGGYVVESGWSGKLPILPLCAVWE